MTELEIYKKVTSILSDFSEMPMKKMKMDSKLMGDLDLNSLDVVNIVMAFEDAFDISIPDSDLDKFKTIADTVSYIKSHG